MELTELQNGLKSNQALEYSGSSISANDTLEGRTECMRIGGRTLVNLWDIKTTNGFYMSDLNNGYFIENNKNFSCEPNTKYTIIYNEKTPTGCFASVLYKDIDGVHISEGVNCYNGKSATFTTPSNCYYLYTRGFRNNTPHTINGNGFNFIIIKGELKEIINYFEGIKSFGEAEQVGDKYKISVLSSGKNLLNFKSFENYIKNTHENEVLYSIKLKPNTNYTFSDKTGEWNGKGAFLILKDKDKKEVSRLIDSNVGNRKSISFTTNNNTNYYLFTYKNNIDKFNSISSNYQIEEGSQATFYEPYQSYKKDILLSAPLRENDYLYEDNGQVKVYRPAKQYTFTGDENFALNASRDDYIRFVINTLPQPVDTDKTGIISNNFPSNSDSITKETVFGYKETGIVFCILKSKLTTPDVEGFKAWLKANPTTIVYQLATPITEIVENCVDIDLDTYQDKTYFSINNTIPGSLDFKVSSNIASIVQNTAREVNNIWDVINNLLVPSLIDINKNVAMATIKNNLK
ncbi:hypothetical protein ACSXD3_18045 (plasmid) [Clostridium perfringens]